MKLNIPGVLIILVAGAAIGAGAAHWYGSGRTAVSGGEPKAAAPSEAQAVRIEVATVELRDLVRGISAVGNLRAEDSAQIRSEIAGRISEIRFSEGSRVSRGDVLVRLDDSVVKAELAQAQANLSLASSQHRRASELSRKGFISQQGRDEAASQMRVQEAAVALAKARMDKTVIVAPFDGVIGLRDVSVGDYVNVGDNIVLLASIDPLNVDFRIPEQYLAQVNVGMSLTLQFDALPGEVRPGRVRAISPVVDVGGRSLLMRASVDNADGLLRPGMFARVLLRFSEEPSLTVPEAALSPSGQTQYVYRVVDDHVQRLAVQIGQRRDGQVEIVAGLTAGDKVVVSGLQKISDGSKVLIIEGDDAASAAS
ncbi:efflux RND transporter periplasmic adaptor subunit [Paracandidimonas soli]|uniref:Membrane fusion protein (Multidrug efflux system) n=1 Tax=Paracandidimonas soli TaxID=1917182 RepID=A0A4R3VC17_9BURK|nr:efflux RND transporter periplasmic adaptor subunit [Paracandidimonas soli]TCV01343.1 membrane fusion protein (multidrug efflux system) [Paracandidimonas soli]